MHAFLKLIKKLSYCLLAIILLITLAMVALNNRSFVISNDFVQKIVKYYDANLFISAEKLELNFLQDKIQLKSPQIKLWSDKKYPLALQNFNLEFNLLKLKGNAGAEIINDDLVSLLYFGSSAEALAIVDNIAKYNSLICSGKLKINIRVFGANEMELVLSSKDGWHDPKKDKLNKLTLKDFYLELKQQNEEVFVKSFVLEYVNGLSISLDGIFDIDDKKLESANFNTKITQLPIDYVASFWPKNILPGLHEWITSNISKGLVSNAEGAFKLTKEDLKASLPRREAIDVKIDCSGMNLKYLDQYTPLSEINGVVKIDGAGLYVSAKDAKMLKSKAENIELSLSFDKFFLSIQANIQGAIAQFKEFIPESLQKDLLSYNIDFSLIKGDLSGKLNMGLSIFEDFKLSNFKLDIRADMSNVILDKSGLIKFKNGRLEILNEETQLKTKIMGNKALALELNMHHDIDLKHQDHIVIDTEITTEDKIVFQDKISINKGSIRPKIDLSGQAWKVDIDLKDAEVALLPLGYIKPKSQSALLQCSGSIKDNIIESESCVLSGKNFAGKISFVYSIKDGALSKLTLENIKLGSNEFNMESMYVDKLYQYKMLAKYLDLTAFTMNELPNQNSETKGYNISFKINKMQMPNKNYLHDVEGKISQASKQPINIDFKAFSENEKVTIIKIMKNGLNGYMLHSKAAARFAQDFGVYSNIKKGEIWIEGYPEQSDGLSYAGTIRLENFAFTNTSAFTKIILGILSPLNSPEAMAGALKGGSLQADSFNADWVYKDGVLSIKNALISGPSYEVKFAGDIDFNKNFMHLKGIYIPSTYGINTLIANLPLLGKLLIGGKDSAFIGSNFKVKGAIKNPKVSFSALSVLTLGFTRNLFN